MSLIYDRLIEYTFTKFGVDSSSRFPVRVQTDRHLRGVINLSRLQEMTAFDVEHVGHDLYAVLC